MTAARAAPAAPSQHCDLGGKASYSDLERSHFRVRVMVGDDCPLPCTLLSAAPASLCPTQLFVLGCPPRLYRPPPCLVSHLPRAQYAVLLGIPGADTCWHPFSLANILAPGITPVTLLSVGLGPCPAWPLGCARSHTDSLAAAAQERGTRGAGYFGLGLYPQLTRPKSRVPRLRSHEPAPGAAGSCGEASSTVAQ